MPRISEFYGIIIWMFHEEHYPPHFHAEYGEHWVRINIETLAPLDRGFPRRQLGMVREWAALHQEELVANWHKAQTPESLDRIEPLP
jgi:hypothetical protein